LTSVLVSVPCDFELGRTWLTGGVDRQSHTGLIFVQKKMRAKCLPVYVSVCAYCRCQANLEAELLRLQRESREKQNVIDEKEEEMYELETRVEKQVSHVSYLS